MRKALVLLFLWVLFLAALLFLLEQAAKSLEPREDIPLHRMRLERPYLYGLNPDHPEINSRGLRGPEIDTKSSERQRIIMLGDSLTYGLFAAASETFSARLQSYYENTAQNVEVINAGVSGYTPYNELKWLETEAADLKPDVIVAVFCMNDLVDPVLHWGDPDGDFKDTPKEAFPNYQKHLTEIRPQLYKSKSDFEQFAEKFALYRAVKKWRFVHQNRSLRYVTEGERQWPVFVADESLQDIRLWTRSDSEEWQWLENMLRGMKQQADRIGARFAAALIPLSYQLEEDYPFRPSENFLTTCGNLQIECLDLLPALRKVKDRNPFMGTHAHHLHDVWHLSEAGHRAVADAFYEFLKRL